MLIQGINVAFVNFCKNSVNFEIKPHLESVRTIDFIEIESIESKFASIESSKQTNYYRIANRLKNTQKNFKSCCLLLNVF